MSDVTIVGNCGEPNLKFTPSGKAVLEFSLAENHSKKNQQGGWDDDGTTWRRVALWDKKGEALGNVLKKGDRVIVTGAERSREWQDKEGATRLSLEVNARDVGIIVRPAREGGGQSDPWAAPGGQQDGGGWGNGPESEPPF
jgi:single-strand DNA-binding protein